MEILFGSGEPSVNSFIAADGCLIDLVSFRARTFFGAAIPRLCLAVDVGPIGCCCIGRVMRGAGLG